MNDKINADRFLGFADIYDNARPSVPATACDILIDYLGKQPDTIVDLGCGTGLSTVIWKDKANSIIGIEPSGDMLSTAKSKEKDNVLFIKAFSDDTTLPDNTADIVVCSQSFHWMDPHSTLTEINRILKRNGVFATIDYDWPPVCNWKAEKEYTEFHAKVSNIECEQDSIKNSFNRWDKNKHLSNIKNSGYFRYSREIVFLNKEKCDADRFIAMALSQGGLQTILKTHPELIEKDIEQYENKIRSILHNSEFDISICYRMRIGIK